MELGFQHYKTVKSMVVNSNKYTEKIGVCNYIETVNVKSQTKNQLVKEFMLIKHRKKLLTIVRKLK